MRLKKKGEKSEIFYSLIKFHSSTSEKEKLINTRVITSLNGISSSKIGSKRNDSI